MRNPTPDDDRGVPIATVSKKYALIQHQQAVQSIVAAFESADWNPATAPAEAWISDYGERLRVGVPVPGNDVDPGDGYPLHAEILVWNSVDRSRAFEIAIRWERLISKNGLTIFDEDRLRKIHNFDWMNDTSPVRFITERLPKSRDRVLDLVRLLQVPTEIDQLIEWADTDVAGRWGINRTARLVHIVKTGRDCAVGRRNGNQLPSEMTVEPLDAVPGARAPAKNAYDAYQALLWIGNKERSIDKQEELLGTVMGLMQPLLQTHSRDSTAQCVRP